jgi:hypothetical protein
VLGLAILLRRFDKVPQLEPDDAELVDRGRKEVGLDAACEVDLSHLCEPSQLAVLTVQATRNAPPGSTS